MAVVGAGMIGCCVARLLARFPAIEVTLIDIEASRGEAAAQRPAHGRIAGGVAGPARA